MRRGSLRIALRNVLGYMALAGFAVQIVSPCRAAITAGHIDDFQDGTTQHWRIGQQSDFPKTTLDSGPQGSGDAALFTTNQQPGSRSLLVVLNDNAAAFPGPGNWEGNWTAAGITQISMDVRNPSVVAGASALTMRVGIGGPGGVNAFGDVYVTQGVAVPPDNNWHSITFAVSANNFVAVGSGMNVAAALADVTQCRIFSNPLEEFIGSSAPNEFFLDNIRAIGAPASLTGDYNQNGAVDAADYVVWRDTLDQLVSPGSGADGTGPAGSPDGMVTLLDYNFWRARFGNSSPASAISAAVPEPSTWLAAALLWLSAGSRLRRDGTPDESCLPAEI